MSRREGDDFNPARVIERDGFVLFWKPPAPFSQWTPSTFSVDGGTFNCAEQYMMAGKARLFGDHEMHARILDADGPAAQKSLGQRVRGFDEDTWRAHRVAIVVRGNHAKFTQNPAMGEALLATGERVLVEASPYDRIWGIGLRADHPHATSPERWRGANLLGQALMEVRARMRGG